LVILYTLVALVEQILELLEALWGVMLDLMDPAQNPGLPLQIPHFLGILLTKAAEQMVAHPVVLESLHMAEVALAALEEVSIGRMVTIVILSLPD
jgi:hypothetical protein